MGDFSIKVCDYIRVQLEKNPIASKYIIKVRPTRDNIEFLTPPVKPGYYPTHMNSAFKTFSERFCTKFPIPDDISACISLLFYDMKTYTKISDGVKHFVNEIIRRYQISSDYSIPPSFNFLHAFNAINFDNITDINLDNIKKIGKKVSAKILQYSLFELSDEYLSILIGLLDRNEALPSLLLDGPPSDLTGCHARILADRIHRMKILPKHGIMSTAIYRLYFDIIKGCNNGNLHHPIPFDPNMVYSDCLFELKHLVRQGKIVMKTKKRKLPPSIIQRKRCVVERYDGMITIVNKDSLVPPGEYELEFLNENEAALAQLLKRLETYSGYCSFIDVEDSPNGGGAKEALVKFFEFMIEEDLYITEISINGFDIALEILEKNKEEGTMKKLLSEIKIYKKYYCFIHECKEIHSRRTLKPAIELALGNNFPFETTVLSIFNRLSALANANRMEEDVINQILPGGYTVLAKTFVALSIKEKTKFNRKETELKVLKDLVDVVIKVFSCRFHGILSWILNDYRYEYPETNKDAIFSYILDKLYQCFTEKGRMKGFHDVFDKIDANTYMSCIRKYLQKRAFAADSINIAIDAMCYPENGFAALIWIIKFAFSNNEDGRKTAFMRMIKNTVTQQFPDENGELLLSKSLEQLVEMFPDMCYIADKDFGVLRECIERKSSLLCKILALPNVKATINCRYRYYGNAPAICLWYLMANIIQQDVFMYYFIINGADPSVTTDEGENVMHFIARGNDLMAREGLIFFLLWDTLKKKFEKNKNLFTTRRHYDGATPIMVAVANRNFCALKKFKTVFPEENDWSLAFKTAFGRSDCLRTIDVMVLLGIINEGNITTAEPSIKLLVNAALEKKLYYNGNSQAPLNMVGLTFDECAYKGVQDIEQAIIHNECICRFASINEKIPHKDSIWCALNYAIIDNYTYFKKEYVQLCTAITNNDRKTLEMMKRIDENKRSRGNMRYSDGTCNICKEDMNELVHELRYIEECNHVYHEFCIKTWENIKKFCPTCKTEYVRSVSKTNDVIIPDS